MKDNDLKDAMDRLQQIMQDRHRGAAELLRDVLNHLGRHPDLLSIDHADETLRLLKRARPSMAAFSELATRLDCEWRSDPGQDAETILSTMEQMIVEGDEMVAERAKKVLRKKTPVSIVTLSYSSTVLEVLRRIADDLKHVMVLKSEPGGEGAKLARKIKSFFPEVELVADEEIGDAVDRADLGISGADTVFTDGVVINKVQTLDLAARLQVAEKPFYVIASRWKFSGFRSEEVPQTEENRFERIPEQLITDILSDPEI